jgi:uncharacterized protein YdhG (YjbR/CyaY superfamily)
MQSRVTNVSDYIKEIPLDKKETFEELRNTIKNSIPKGFEEQMSYGMVGYVVPHALYPKGYHCDPKLPLPFVSIASQKNFIALYHMGIYANPALLKWFVDEYPKHSKGKLDMGKSCIRFKKTDDIPLKLIKELIKKMTTKEWIELYESAFVKAKK